MEVVEAYKYLGLVYFVVIWAAILYILGREPHDRTRAVSHHAAASKEMFIMFAVVRTLALPLWMLFTLGWLVPALALPSVAAVLFAVAIAGDMVSAWVPAVDGKKGVIHGWGALTMLAMFVPLAVLFAFSPEVSELARMVIRADILLMFSSWILFVTHQKTKKYYLYFQLAYFILFDTAFLSAAFL